jgi:hypothetical protein
MSIFSRLFQREDGVAPPNGSPEPANGQSGPGTTANPASPSVSEAEPGAGSNGIPGAAPAAEAATSSSAEDTAPNRIDTPGALAAVASAKRRPPPPPSPKGERGDQEPPPITASAVDEAFEKLMTGGGATPPPVLIPGSVAAVTAAAPPSPPPAPGVAPPAAKAGVRHGTSTAEDHAAVRATFEELAVGHVSPIRNFMIEVRWGEAQASWIEMARPALKSLRAMAEQVEIADLVAALDGFGGALDKVAKQGGSAIAGEAKDILLAAYAPLIARWDRAFALDGERDRREPVIVQALLQQVQGLEPLMFDRVFAVGLNRLESLFPASAEEIAVVAELPLEVASAIVAKVEEFRRTTPAGVASTESPVVRRQIEALITGLEGQHLAFERASQGWSKDNLQSKKRSRRDRDTAWLQMKVALARLGEIDFLVRLEKQPFGRRIEDLNRFVREGSPPRAPVETPRKSQAGGIEDGRAHT